MNITPFLSGLLSSAANSGYSVNVRGNIIRIKISDNETINITQSQGGDIYCSLSKHGIVQKISKSLVYDFLFEYDEYGYRIYYGRVLNEC
ncbi:hypothetical protein FIC68_21310 [Salmonella enterica]|nr:hypothetical protein [Salmonella enterica]